MKRAFFGLLAALIALPAAASEPVGDDKMGGLWSADVESRYGPFVEAILATPGKDAASADDGASMTLICNLDQRFVTFLFYKAAGGRVPSGTALEMRFSGGASDGTTRVYPQNPREGAGASKEHQYFTFDTMKLSAEEMAELLALTSGAEAVEARLTGKGAPELAPMVFRPAGAQGMLAALAAHKQCR